jgi:N-glycosylase/DNA lyase
MDTYLVQSSNRIFSLYQKGDFLFYQGVEEPFLIRFFRLDEDLDFILKEIDRDPMIHRAIKEYRGMRLIKQDPWECLISFLCSSAKSISHIRSMLEAFCKSSGPKIFLENHLSYGFPEPRCIKTPLQLEPVRAGFRASYLIQAYRYIDRKYLLSLIGLPYKEAREQLMSLPGVGKKVADCTLLYSLDFIEAFPMDTWIKKGLKKVYFKGKKAGEKAMEEFVSHHFGPYAGYAQLYLYHFWRHHLF